LTATRAVLASSILGLAVYQESRSLLILGLLVSWAGDMVDGHLARAWRCETVLGAQLDGLVDRLTAIWVVVGSVVIAGGSPLAVAAAVAVWLQFGVLDHALSTQFLRRDRWSPDEFHLDDVDAWRLNWSPLAKVMSNVPVGLLALGGIATWGALAGAVLLLMIRTGSSLRLLAGLSVSSPREGTPATRRPLAVPPPREPVHEVTSARETDRGHDDPRVPASVAGARPGSS
jgi:hypothetical protein